MEWHNFLLSFNKNQRVDFIINGRNITFEVKYNTYNDTWIFNIYEDNKPLICGNTLVTGFDITTGYNLLNQYEYLGLGELYLWAINYDKPSDYPTIDSLTNFLFTWKY